MNTAQPQGNAPPIEGQGKLIELKWSVTFNQKFPVDHDLTQTEFVELAREQVEWLKGDFIKQLEGYPKTLLVTLNKYDCLDKATFQNNKANG